MNKFFTKAISLAIGAAMVAGVGIAVGSKEAQPAYAATEELTFNVSSNPGGWPTTNSTTETAYNYTLSGVDYEFTLKNVKCNSGYLMCTSVAALGLPKLSNGKLTKIVVSNSSGCSQSTRVGVSSSSSSASYIGGGSYQTWSTQGSSYTYNLTGTANNTRYYLYVTNKNAQMTSITLTYETAGASDHTVTNSVSHGTISPTSVADGGTLTATITPDTWYSVPTSVSVTMGGSSVDHTYSNGIVTVQNVTGDVVITGQCVKTSGPEHEGTQADPYTVADAYLAIDDNAGITGVYVEAVVSGIVTSWSTQYNNISFNMSEDGGTEGNQLQAYRCGNSSEHPIASDDDLPAGATVVVKGNLKKYNSTYEFDSGCTIVSYTAPVSSPLSSITLSGTHKTTFDVGDEFSYSGLVVTAHYENGTERSVTNYSVSTPDMTSAGQKTVTVTYTENEVEKSAEYTITINAVTLWEISFKPGEGSGEMESVHVKEGADYTLPACTFTAPEGKVFDYWEVNGAETTVISSVDDDYEATAIYKDKPAEVTDTLNNGNTVKNSDSSYINWTSTGFDSGAEYAGQSAGGNESIQLRSNNSNSGIVTTTSGGTVVSVKISFNSHTSATRTVSVYGKNSAYSAPTDLYGDASGTKLGDVNIDDGAEQTITVTDSYEYVGIRSKSGALYIDSVEIVWNSGSQPEAELTGISVSGAKANFTVGDEFVTTGLVVTGHYKDADDRTITGYTIDDSAVNKDAAGTYSVEVSYGGFTDSYDVTYAAVVTATYKKVETNLADFSGSYLIVYEEGNFAFDGHGDNMDATPNTTAISIAENEIELDERSEFIISAKEDGYSVKSKSGWYIGKTADSNGMDSKETDNYTNSISYVSGDTPDMQVVGSGGAHLRYNSANNQNKFRFYSSTTYTGQKAISLFIRVENDAEALALDILNLTSEACAAAGEHSADQFSSAWSTLKTAYAKLGDEKSELVNGDADAHGTFVAEALARYDLLVLKYGLENFISGRTPQLAGVYHYGETIDSSSAMIVVVIAAVTSLTSIAVLLVIKRRRALSK